VFDALGVFLPDAQAPGDRLAELRPLRNDEGFRGLLGNLRVVQGRAGVYILGSLPVYLNGENALTLTRQGLRTALGKLEDESGLDLHAGRVCQLETAATLPVREAPRRYLESWGPLPRFRKDTYGGGETVLYRTGGRSFTGYDKGAELDPEPLPCPLEGRYALRLELRYKRGLARILGRPMNPWELAEPEPYRAAVERWKRLYFAIPKRREVCLVMDGLTTKRLERSLAALGLQTLGLDRLAAIIRDGQASGALDRTTATRMRQLARELGQDGKLTDTEPLTQEIDEKVRAVARFAR
jgi:hypothetical protein